MKRRNKFIGYTLILLILVGLVYIGYSLYYNPQLITMLDFTKNKNDTNNTNVNNTTSMNGMNMPSSNTNKEMSGMSGMSGSDSINPSTNGTASMLANMSQFSQLSMKNKEKVTQFITLLSDAVNQITLDPYSSITTKGSIPDNKNMNQQETVNIYPNGTNTVNLHPNISQGSNPANNKTTTVPSKPTVMSQNRLQQLHEGIYKLSQGMMIANDLNDDLIQQASTVEINPPSYQTYLFRYNSLIQDKLKFSNAINLLNSASTLINVNPYGQLDGYEYDPQGMEQLHKGIFKLAQAMGLATAINNDFLIQISNASYDLSNFSSMNNMNMDMGNPLNSFFDLSNLSNKVTWVIVVLVILFILGLVGTISSFMQPRRRRPDTNPPRQS